MGRMVYSVPCTCLDSSAVKQRLGARATELFEPRLPRARYVFRVVRAPHTLKCVGVDEQARIVVNLPVLRVEAAERDRYLKPGADGPEARAVCDGDVDAAALLALEDGGARREAHGHEAHARQSPPVKIRGKLPPVEPRRADKPERRVR